MKHIRIHKGDKPYACTECDEMFIRASSLGRHKLVHTGEKTFPCAVFDKRFTASSNLRPHYANSYMG